MSPAMSAHSLTDRLTVHERARVCTSRLPGDVTATYVIVYKQFLA